MTKQNSLADKSDKISLHKLESLQIHHYLKLVNLHRNEEHQILTIFQKYKLSEIISHHILIEVNPIKVIKCKTIRNKIYNKKYMNVRRIIV